MVYAISMIAAIALVLAVFVMPHRNKFNLHWPIERIGRS